MSKFLPAEHYDWFWNELRDRDPNNRVNLNKFRQRFLDFQKRLNRGPRFYERLSKLRQGISQAFENSGIELGELPANNTELYNLIEDPGEDIIFDLQDINNIELQPLEYESVTDYGSAGGEFATSLPAAEAGLGVTGAATSAPGAGTVIGGAGAALGTIGIGVGIVGASGGFNLPGHNFIGPGNDADRPEEPVDTDDSIAQVHDKEYQNAKDQETILRVDQEAIDAFDKDWQENSNWHSLAGKTGLQIKNIVEKKTGVLYPSNLPSISGKCALWFRSIRRIKTLVKMLSFLKNPLTNMDSVNLEIELNMFGMFGIQAELKRDFLV
jgi:hypothetical protein